MEIQVFRNENNSQTNAYLHYSNYSYSGLIPNERALTFVQAADLSGSDPPSGSDWLIFLQTRKSIWLVRLVGNTYRGNGRVNLAYLYLHLYSYRCGNSVVNTLVDPEQISQVIPLFTIRVEMNCYTNNFPGLLRFEILTADQPVIAEWPLLPFVIIW